MSLLEPVSFRKGREYAPRLSAPRVPGIHSRRFWSEDEKAIVRRYYPEGGVAPCLAHLPNRTATTIYQQAGKMGLKAPGARREMGYAKPPENFDEILREEWPKLTGRGAVTAFADRLNISRRLLYVRALNLGLTLPHKKEPNWTEAENALMKRVPLHDTVKASRIFREHGFQRSPTSIMVHAKRVGLSRRYKETLSATSAARILGCDAKNLSLKCGKELKATKRKTQRLPQQGGDPWSITRADLRQYVIDNLERIDIRKVDKLAFVDLLVNGVGK